MNARTLLVGSAFNGVHAFAPLLACLGMAIASSAANLDSLLVGNWPGFTNETTYALAVRDRYAYVTFAYGGDNGSIGSHVIDVSNPANPQRVGGYQDHQLNAYPSGMALAGSYAYLAYARSGLRIIDISDPANPRGAGYYNGGFQGLAVSGSYAYLADYYSGLQVVNISNSTHLQWVGGYHTPDRPSGVAVSGSYAYVADGWGGLQVIDVSDPANPQRVGGYETSDYASGVAVSGNYAYVAAGYAGLLVIDVSNPASPQRVGRDDSAGYVYRVTVDNTYAYLTGNGNLRVIDISNPADPWLVGSTSSGYPYQDQAVAVQGDKVFVTGKGLKILQKPQLVVDFLSANYSVAENAGTLLLTARRTGDTNRLATVAYTTANGTAQANSDYTPQDDTITFQPGETTHTISISILNDGLTESEETFQVILSNLTADNSTGAVLGAQATTTIAIRDNDSGIQFSTPRYAVSESGGVAFVNVNRSDDVNNAVTVDYGTSDGTALAGLDFAAQAGTLRFAAGETNQPIAISILDDGLAEGHEFFRLTLSNPTGGAYLGANSQAVLTILDDEPIPFRPRVKPIAAGTAHSVALKADGSLWTWGDGSSGELGLGDGVFFTNTPAPVVACGQSDWLAVSAGQLFCDCRRTPGHTVALNGDGSLWAWGVNWYGQLGIGTAIPETNIPVRIGTDFNWASMATRGSHTVALKTNGSLWAWGNNASGELGIGAMVYFTNVPLRVGSDNDWRTVEAGDAHTVALKSDGSLWAWGGNYYGELGIGAGAYSTNLPVRVGTDNDWAEVAGGYYHTVALRTDGSLWAWGYNGAGQLGLGTNVLPTNVPLRIGADHDWMALVAGSSYTLALKSDGSLWAWGDNWAGQLGIGSSVPSTNVPVRVGTDNDWATFAAGDSHTLALKVDGSLWVWGANWRGQLGLGAGLSATNVPVRVGTQNDWGITEITAPASTVEFRITHQAVGTDGRLWLTCSRTNRAYYVLYRGAEITNILQAVDARLGDCEPPLLVDPTPVSFSRAAFYRVVAIPLSEPLDLDNDGIDDVYELRHSLVLNPLNSADAAEDFDRDGKSNLREYLAGTDPSFPDGGRCLAVGGRHQVALRTDGSVWAWGYNYYGQLGDGTATDRPAPVRVGSETNWSAVAAGGAHTAALKAEGSLWAWGANFSGQVGDGTSIDRIAPVRLGTDNDWRNVAAGGDHTVARKADGSLWAWGDNSAGQLGICNFDLPSAPVRIGSDIDWSAVTAGAYHTVALKGNGTLWAWGANYNGQLGNGTFDSANCPLRIGGDSDWLTVAASETATLALKRDGSLWSWGNGLPEPLRIGTENDWAAIAAGGFSCFLARKRDGSLWAWGSALLLAPDGVTLTHAEAPVRVGTGTDWVEMAAGDAGNLALRTDRTLWHQSPSGADKPTPTRIGAAADWAVAAAGGTRTGALKTNGTLWAWGSGYLGDGTTEAKAAPISIGTDADWMALAAGGGHSVALKIDGSLRAWGDNHYGQLGIGSSVYYTNIPVRVGTDNGWQSIAAGYGGTVALEANRTLWGWGANWYGELGDGTTANRPAPVRIGLGSDWQVIAAGGSHTAALKTDGSLWAWGYNYFGQLGDGTTSNRATPVRIGTDNDWRSIAAGGEHTVAQKTDGSLWAWGWNDRGQLGDGTTTSRNAPVRIGTGNDWQAIALGDAHTVALKTDRSLWAWGVNGSGQLGDGTFTVRTSPVRIGFDTDWIALTAGWAFSIAQKADGSLWGWGSNRDGQLGDPNDFLPRRVGTDSNWGCPP